MAASRALLSTFMCLLSTHVPLMGYHLNHEILNQEIFSCIYRAHIWDNPESRSGPFSTLEHTKTIRSILPHLFAALEVHAVLDAGCGDCHWIKEVPLAPGIRYVGIDIVREAIQHANAQNQDAARSYDLKNFITDELPCADIIVCRDCFSYLTLDDIRAALKNFKKSGARYLLATNAPHITANQDFSLGDILDLKRYRPINLCKAPFFLPEPLALIEEQTDSQSPESGRCLALWCLQDLLDF